MRNVISAEDLRPTVQPRWSEERLRARAPHAVSIAVDDSAMTIRFDDALCAALFAERYADQLAAHAARLVHYVVGTQAGYLFWSRGGQAWSWDHGPLSARAVVFLADATAIAALIRASSQLLSLHAAAIAYDGIAAAIAGDASAGKTTTAIACARRGMGLYSDERCIVRDGLVVPFARTLNVRSEGWRLLAQDRVDAGLILSAQPRRYGDAETLSVRISELFGPNAIASPAPLRAVFLVSGREERPRLARVAWCDVAPALMRWMDSKEQGLPRVARLVHALREACCFRLFLGPPDASALLVRAALAEVIPAHAG